VHHAGQRRRAACGSGEQRQLRTAARGQLAPVQSHQVGHKHGVVARGHEGQRIVAARLVASPVQQDGPRAPLVDAKVVDDRLHGEGQRRLEFPLRLRHDLLHPVLGRSAHGGIEDEPHPAAGHAAQHQESPEVLAVLRFHPLDQAFRVEGRGPRDDRLEWPGEIARGECAQPADITALQGLDDLVEDAARLLPAQPLCLRPQQVLLRHHFQDRSDVLRHPPMHEHQAVLQRLPGRRWHLIRAEDAMVGQEAAPADAGFGVVCAGQHARDQLDARPHPARILPAAPRSGEPLAEDGTRGHQPALMFGQLSGEGTRLTGGPHAAGDEAGEQAGGDGQPRPLGNAVDAADQLDAASRTHHAGQQIGQALL